MAKDNFSAQSGWYAKYRPGYPMEMIEFLASLVPSGECAWDAGTGNGQLAVALSQVFKQVYATDLSRSQIDKAVQRKNITYRVEPGEECTFGPDQFDLITVGQAIHWFDFGKFYPHVMRTLKPMGIFAVLGYDVFRVNPEVDRAVDSLYHGVLGPFWDPERTYVENHYRNIPFPFDYEMRESVISSTWDLEDAIGYLNSWSAVRHFIDKVGWDPVADIKGELSKSWGEGPKQVHFPVFMRFGRKGS